MSYTENQKALYDLDSQNDITQPDNPLYWPKGAVKDLSQDEPKEKGDLDELELLQKNYIEPQPIESY